MRFQVSVLTAVAFATLVPALNLPQWTVSSDSTALDVEYNPALPESGQIVDIPVAFGDEELEFAIEDDAEMDSAMFEDWKQSVVRQHNEYRAKYGAAGLSWSDALYGDTLKYAQQCKFQHSNGGGKYGENLAAGTGNAYGFTNGLKDWMNEACE
ncbi:hypothetical protein PQX77_007613 [Marasmius sp. AFHP31]|nr:hypothetical protein PQX77_007613 [Marasmius sp. AFHP31]